MMTTLEHPLVKDYLDRLDAESVRLPASEGRELQTQIREHLVEALPGDPAEVEVRDALDRLGDPVDLVDAAGGAREPSGRAPSPESDGASDSAWREAGALVGLVGFAALVWLPGVNVLLWVGGLVLLVLSRRWSVADKVWGALVLGLGPWLFILGSALAWTTITQVCESDAAGVVTCSSGGDGGLTALNIVVGALVVAYLVLYVWTLVRLGRRAARAGGA